MEGTPLPPLYEEPQKSGWKLPVIVASLLGLGLLAAFLWLGRPGPTPPPPPAPAALPPLSEETRAYAKKIQVNGLELSRWENFLGQDVIYLDGLLTNPGERTLLAVELTVEFHDTVGQVVLRQKMRPVGAPPGSPSARLTPPLPPGETRTFRTSFDRLPVDWNGQLPSVQITGLLIQ